LQIAVFNGTSRVNKRKGRKSMSQQTLKIPLTLGITVIVTVLLMVGPLALDAVLSSGRVDWVIRAAPVLQGTPQPMIYLPIVLRNAEFKPSPTPTPTATVVPGLLTLHLEASAVSPEQCIQCHGNKADERSLDPVFPTAHRVHLTSGLLNFQCTACHQSVDLLQGSATSLRKQVDVGLCATCHSPFPSVMQPAWRNLDCTTCHANWQTRMAGATYVNLGAITAQDCLKCHGGAAWYQERR